MHTSKELFCLYTGKISLASLNTCLDAHSRSMLVPMQLAAVTTALTKLELKVQHHYDPGNATG